MYDKTLPVHEPQPQAQNFLYGDILWFLVSYIFSSIFVSKQNEVSNLTSVSLIFSKLFVGY